MESVVQYLLLPQSGLKSTETHNQPNTAFTQEQRWKVLNHMEVLTLGEWAAGGICDWIILGEVVSGEGVLEAGGGVELSMRVTQAAQMAPEEMPPNFSLKESAG